ncbi:leucine-rich repeat domain-containing protein [Paenibacillus sp. WQ 127069]|uniref:Leucine-rich repeat domain-containing protein n=2 Tax=Paenibacillus baimaensis TaxID=2982185 RepID=A0ABT2UE93_9BACL|nr:leucine-rich repeat domain-containing protein [Paenibacillus sp. WQ 127069]
MQIGSLNIAKADGVAGDRIIKDPQLEQIIRDTINKPQGDLTPLDLKQIKQLKGDHQKIESLEGLQFATQLTEIWLSYNQITDISPIKNLINLQEIYCESNGIADLTPISELINLSRVSFTANRKISDLTPIKNLQHLEYADFSITNVIDLSALSNLPNLKTLELMSNKFSDLSPLANLQSLERLAIGSNKNISDLSPLNGLIHLKVLWITEDGLTDISSLAGLESLKELHAYKNNIQDISALQNLKNLEFVTLSNNKIQDISPLLKLKSLKNADLYGNFVPDEALKELTKHTNPNPINLNTNQPKLDKPNPPQLSAKPIRFRDVNPSDWFYEDIQWAAGKGMIAGYDDGTFVPDAKITEAEFLKMLISLYLGDLSKKNDLHWYDGYYRFAKEHKWDVSGLPYLKANSVDYTGPLPSEKPLIRLEAAMLLLNAVGKEADAPDELIWEMYNWHFSEGKTDKSVYGYQINDLLTRAEAVSLLWKFKENNPNNELLPVTQTVEANRVLSISRISSAIQQLAYAKGYQVKQPAALNRWVREEGNISQMIRVNSENNPKFSFRITVNAEQNQFSHINMTISDDARSFTRELLDTLLENQSYKSTIMNAFDLMPQATLRSMDVDLPYNHSVVYFDTNSFNIRLYEHDKKPFGYSERF